MQGKVLGLYLHNPQTTAPTDLRSYAALEIEADDDKNKTWPKDWETVHIAGGPAAVLTVRGGYHQLPNAWQSFGPLCMAKGWKFSTNPQHISQEMYIEMDKQDESQNITKLVLFLQE